MQSAPSYQQVAPMAFEEALFYDIVYDYAPAESVKSGDRIFANPERVGCPQFTNIKQAGRFSNFSQVLLDSIVASVGFEKKRTPKTWMQRMFHGLLFILSLFWTPLAFPFRDEKEPLADRIHRLQRFFLSQSSITLVYQDAETTTFPLVFSDEVSTKNSTTSSATFRLKEMILIPPLKTFHLKLNLSEKLIEELKKNDDLNLYFAVAVKGVSGKDFVNG